MISKKLVQMSFVLSFPIMMESMQSIIHHMSPIAIHDKTISKKLVVFKLELNFPIMIREYIV